MATIHRLHDHRLHLYAETSPYEEEAAHWREGERMEHLLSSPRLLNQFAEDFDFDTCAAFCRAYRALPQNPETVTERFVAALAERFREVFAKHVTDENWDGVPGFDIECDDYTGDCA